MPKVEAYLVGQKISFTKKHDAAPLYKIIPSGYAEFTDYKKIPTGEGGLAYYKLFAKLPMPRALAISNAGALFSSVSHRDPVTEAMLQCESNNQKGCKIYAVDDVVVYKP